MTNKIWPGIDFWRIPTIWGKFAELKHYKITRSKKKKKRFNTKMHRQCYLFQYPYPKSNIQWSGVSNSADRSKRISTLLKIWTWPPKYHSEFDKLPTQLNDPETKYWLIWIKKTIRRQRINSERATISRTLDVCKSGKLSTKSDLKKGLLQ